MPARLSALVWLAAVAVVGGFFLPWATLDIKTTKTEKEISASVQRAAGKSFGSAKKPKRQPSWIRAKRKKAPLLPSKVSGYQIPLYANRRNVKAVMGLAEMVTKKREAVGLKSYAVYAVPGLALVAVWVLGAFGERWPAAAAVALMCGAVAGYGLWMLTSTDTRKEYAFSVGIGLWISLGAYVMLTLAGALALPASLRGGAAARR
jgi:hypothetical protein